MRLIDFFDRGLMLNPDGPCLIEGDNIITYADAADISRRVAQAASESGMQPGTKAAVYSPNHDCREWRGAPWRGGGGGLRVYPGQILIWH